jgi:F-type H+-transporting ATPase subunit a
MKNFFLLLITVCCFCVCGFAVAQEHGAPADAAHGTVATGDAHGAPAPSHAPDALAPGGHGHEATPPPELPSFITVILNTRIGDHFIKDTHFGHFLHVWEKQIIMVIVVILLGLFMWGTLGMRANIPGKMQSLVEMGVEGFYNFIGGIMGEAGKKYVPFLGTLFLFIWVNNLMGIVPGFAAATSKYQTTVTLALVVFVYVNYVGIKEGGLKHYLWHLAGSPKDAIGWALFPLMLPLEIIGTLAKPLSLSLRLFGNIMGEDILVGVFLMLGLSLMGAFWHDPLFGVPLHFPFLFLALLTATIQALVFTLLSTIYIMLVLPHHEHEEHHEESHPHTAHHPEMPGVPEDKTPHIGATSAPFTG